MCGICGIINKKPVPVDINVLKRMTRILAHRGPDGEGIYIKGHVGLGHRRLSVIDLSENAKQPMCNEDGSVVIVFNGMIYNYKELSERLKKQGHFFRSNSDTEAILHLYEELGYDCVRQLRGMFAFALWDNNKEELILARDRIGQKPLVYAEYGGVFLFASEPKSILATGIFNPEVDPLAFHSLFSYKSIPYPRSMFKNICKLPPASIMIVRDGEWQIKQYWKPEFDEKTGMDIGEALVKLENLIDESVRLRLLSDVPVGTFLSGGVDSSIITLSAKRNRTKPLVAFSVGYEKGGIQDLEFRYADSVAANYNIEHKKILVDEGIIGEMERVVWHYDEPFPIPEALVNMRFCQEVKKEVTVVLTGDGGDEIFAGYSGYVLWKLIGDIDNFLRRNPLAKGAISLLGKIIPIRALKILLVSPQEKRSFIKSCDANTVARSLYSKKFMKFAQPFDIGAPLRDVYKEVMPSHLLDGILFMDLVLNDVHGTCVFSDISGMANGLEIRAPLLDQNIVEFAVTLPVWMKINGLKQKYIFKKLAQSMLPMLTKKIFTRKKLGYGEGIPLRRWFLQDWRERVEGSFFDNSWNENGFVDNNRLKRLCEAHFSGKSNHFVVLWVLYCYSVWHKIFIREFNKNINKYPQ